MASRPLQPRARTRCQKPLRPATFSVFTVDATHASGSPAWYVSLLPVLLACCSLARSFHFHKPYQGAGRGGQRLWLDAKTRAGCVCGEGGETPSVLCTREQRTPCVELHVPAVARVMPQRSSTQVLGSSPREVDGLERHEEEIAASNIQRVYRGRHARKRVASLVRGNKGSLFPVLLACCSLARSLHFHKPYQGTGRGA